MEGVCMSRALRLSFLVAFALCLLYSAVAVAVVAAYYDPENSMNYLTPVGLEILPMGARSVRTAALRQAFTVREWILGGCFVSGLLTFAFTWKEKKSRLRCIVFGAHLAALPWGWLGLLLIPISLIQGVDGEWLSEHWPTYIAAALWIVCAIAMLIVSVDGRWFRGKPAIESGSATHSPL
jgi:hypothetical protein